MTPERQYLNEVMLPLFKEMLLPDEVVFDIGKSETWDYKKVIPSIITVDRDRAKKPDILMDVEKDLEGKFICKSLICNGVTEQCDNPFTLIEGVIRILNNHGLALFGINLLGYPYLPNTNDNFRFTPDGAIKAVSKYFDILIKEILYRDTIASYIYIIGRKK